MCWTVCRKKHLFTFYHQISNISRTLVGNNIVVHSDVVGAVRTGGAPTTSEWTTSSFLTKHLASKDWAKTPATRDEKHLSLGIWCITYIRDLTAYHSAKLKWHRWLKSSLLDCDKHLCIMHHQSHGWWWQWVGVTKPISSFPFFFKFFSIVKIHIRY